MNQIKNTKCFTWLAALLLTGSVLTSCGSSETKTDETKTETTTAPAQAAPADSPRLSNDTTPPIDTSASGRPDGIKTK